MNLYAMTNDPTLAKAAPEVFLRAVWDDTVLSVPLPRSGVISLGRGAEADVQVQSQKTSRKHALVRIAEDGSLSISDAASANGTYVKQTRVAPKEWNEVQFGEPFVIGEALVVIQRGSVGSSCRRVVGPDGFEEALLAELLARRSAEAPFSVATIECRGAATRTLDCAAAVLTPGDVMAYLNDATIALLLGGRSPAAALLVVGELEAYLRHRGARASSRTLHYPADGVTPEQLFPRRTAPDPNASETIRPANSIAHSAEMRRIYAMVEQIAPTSTSVLILGETGTGKDVIARAIHERSTRASGPLVALNCAALPENLLESELFGYERGAFTGAVAAKPGQFELAATGTLFLDEIGDLPLAAQAKLLRVLEERSVLRLGAVKVRPVDVRIISATNSAIEELVQSGKFRADLYYRLNGFALKIPPLAHRRESIVPLALHFASRAAATLDKAPPIIATEVLQALLEYTWPGNIRELRSVIERAVLLCRTGIVQLEHLPDLGRAMRPTIVRAAAEPASATMLKAHLHVPPEWDAVTSVNIPHGVLPPAPVPSPPPPPSSTNLDAVLAAIETFGIGARGASLSRELVLAALERCGGNQTEAAKLLRISRRTLISRIEQFGIARPRKAK